jgi:hypothetical protein
MANEIAECNKQHFFTQAKKSLLAPIAFDNPLKYSDQNRDGKYMKIKPRVPPKNKVMKFFPWWQKYCFYVRAR